MTAADRATPVGSGRCSVLGVTGGNASGRAVPARARGLAARLAALFTSDCQIVARLNDAQRRLCDANDRLWSGLSPDAFGLIYDAPAAASVGGSQIAAVVGDALSAGDGPELEAVVLGALQQVHWRICRAFREYQSACEERRQLAVDVGELAAQLTAALCAGGWTEEEAREANVHELAGAAIR
jgi:hypothetical protein